ncbi:MAG: cyclic nucleotide-binding domain-containing protein [Pseudobdellovibrionaceae bacterium]
MREGQIRKFKKGEIIFREGEKGDMAYVIQAGLVSLSIEKSQSRIEMLKLGKGNMIGFHSVLGWGDLRFFTAEATLPVELLEVPLEVLKTHAGSFNNVQRLLLKSLSDQSKTITEEQKSFKIEKDGAACPPTALPRLAGCLNLTTRRFGAEEKGEWSISWSTLRMFTLRMFLESTGRMQSFCELLGKIGVAQIIRAVNEETNEEEVTFIRIKDLSLVEDFCDFYQRNLYKQGRSKIIEIDKLCLNVMRAFVVGGEGAPVDPRQGAQIPLQTLIEKAKAGTGFVLKQEHFELLKERSLDIKKTNSADSITISFNLAEFQRIYRFWQIIHEVDKWNVLGRVDLHEKEEKKVSVEGACSGCGGGIQESMKFCPHCGAKRAA